MTDRVFQKLSKDQKEKWAKLAGRIKTQEMLLQEEWSDLSDGMINFEKMSKRSFKKT